MLDTEIDSELGELDTENTSELDDIPENASDEDSLAQELDESFKEEQKEKSKAGQVASAAALIIKGEKSIDDYDGWIKDEIHTKFAKDDQIDRIKALEEKIQSQEKAEKESEIKAFKGSVLDEAKLIKESDRKAFASECVSLKKANSNLSPRQIIALAKVNLDIESTPRVKVAPERITNDGKPSGWQEATPEQIEQIDSETEWDSFKKANR